MSLTRLAIFIFLILTYSKSQAQKDSVANSIDSVTTSALNKIDKTTSSVKAKADTCINILNNAPTKYLDKVETGVSKGEKKLNKAVTLTEDSISNLLNLSNKYISKVSTKADEVNNQLSKKTLKYLHRFQKHEKQLERLLMKKDSSATAKIFRGSQQHLKQLENKFKNSETKISDKVKGKYNGYLDSLKTTVKFLKGNKYNSQGLTSKLDNGNKKINQLEDKLQSADEIKQYIKERKELLKQALDKYGLGKKIKKLDKDVYYYKEYVKEYKEVFKDPEKIEKKALTLLKNTAVYKKFMAQNSFLGFLWKMPGDDNSTASNNLTSITGMQTRQNVQQIMESKVSVGGPNAIKAVQQQIRDGQSQLNSLKDKIRKNGNADDDLPIFKPNEQKTKSFLKRLEYSATIQFGKSNNYFPATSDIAASIGYKLNNKGIIGIGGSYKLGLGRGWDKIKFTQQGIGLRSYIDWKIKKSIFISGGYEKNYFPSLSAQQLSGVSKWQNAGLIGLSKKIKLKPKLSCKAQLLFNFLSYKQIPKSQPFIYRISYVF